MLNIYDNSVALIKRLEINLSPKKRENVTRKMLKNPRFSHERFYTVDIVTHD